MNRIHLIHGIHTTREDVSTPELFIPDLLEAGYERKDIVVHNYGYALGIKSRWENEARAKKIAQLIDPGDKIIAHSNGCLITLLMLRMGIAPSTIALLQPALDVDTVFPLGNYKINVFYNNQDKATLLARWLLWFHHPYGAMGRYGHEGEDERITNYDTLKIANVGGHSKCYAISTLLRQKVIESINERDLQSGHQ